ncbi:MAG: SdiA-regulated domain-containing protein [Kiritimatiellae bacterium]|nr:SdiA-regulated domain-containing protein [Kiritimatiellia bacterium]
MKRPSTTLCLALYTCFTLGIGTSLSVSAGSILDEYTLARGPVTVLNVEEDLSGITYLPESGTLYGVLNDPPSILVLNDDLQIAKTILLAGFDDTEDIVHVAGERFAVVEERRRQLCEFTLTTDANRVNYADAAKILIEPTDFANKGLEGVGYSAAKNQFFIIKEKKPRRIYAVSRTALGEADAKITRPWDIEAQSHDMKDLSAVIVDPKSGHLLLLSDDSSVIVETTTSGEMIGSFPLKAGHAGLKADIPQAEGLTFGKDGTLYVVSEPNMIYEFKRP